MKLKSKVDLHVHSTKSDGSYTPAELVEYAVQKGLTAFALTDHDTTAGIPEALAAARSIPGMPLTVIPGIEFSSTYEGRDIHILGLYIDCENEFFKGRLEAFINSRTQRNREMCEKLRTAGIDITYEKLTAEFPEGVITRPHFAKYLLNHGYINHLKEAYERFIGDRCSCYVPRRKMTPTRAVEIILKAGGLPILAHPLLYHLSDARLDTLVKELAAVGLAGIEAVYPSHSPSDERKMRALAAKYHLCISGGSDFHGSSMPGLNLADGYGQLYIPESILADLQQELRRRRENPDLFRPRKILFTDLDGTLLNSQKQISPYTKEVLDAWVNAGHRLVLCSGRDINSVGDVKRDLGLDYPGMFLIGYNGGQIYECDTGKTLCRTALTLEQTAYICDAAKEQNVHCHAYTDTHIISPYEDRELIYYQHAIRTPVIISEDVTAVMQEGSCKCLAIALEDPDKLEHFRLSLQSCPAGRQITTIYSSPYYLEIFPANSGKGAALKKLCEILNIPMALSLAAGDQENDLPMLQAAGTAIAMQNALDELKKNASVITLYDNNHDGLATALKDLL